MAAIAVVGLCACVAVRSQLAANVERVRNEARGQWTMTGKCFGHELVQCQNGRRELRASDGYSSWVTAYDARDVLVYELEGGCVSRQSRGLSLPCRAPVLERDLCQEELGRLELRVARVVVTCGSLQRTVEVARGGSARLELVAGAALQVSTSHGFEVSFESAPDGVEVSACDSGACKALAPSQLLTSREVSVSGRDRAQIDCTWAPLGFEFAESVDTGPSKFGSR